MRFSIIIPVYNVEKYIRKCMQTVMEQTFRDYEVIVVDDETPDNSMAIVEEFAEKYPGMIKMIHQKNTRQGGARNRGVREAQGEYILFVDSDDYVSVHMLEIVNNHLKEKEFDIISFRYRRVTPSGRMLQVEGRGSLEAGEYIPKMNKEIMLLPAGPVHKAYRRDFYLACNVWFPEKVLYEDAVVRVLFASAQSVALIDECLYYYVQSESSSIRQKPSEKMLDILTVSDLVIEEFKRRGLYEEFREPLEASIIYGIAYILDLINEMDKSSPIQSYLTEYIRTHFPEYACNKWLDSYLITAMKYLEKDKFVRYHYQVLVLTQIKEWLLGWSFIEKMNQLRHKVLYKYAKTNKMQSN